MFYIVKKDTTLHKQLIELDVKIVEVNKVASDFLDTIPNSTKTYAKPRGLAGGIDLVGFPKKELIPENWIRKYEERGVYYCRPRTGRNATKEINAKLDALPKLEDSELNNLVNYDPWLTLDELSAYWAKPSFYCEGDIVLLAIAEEQLDCGYKPVKGMTEITKTEFNAKLGEIRKIRYERKSKLEKEEA